MAILKAGNLELEIRFHNSTLCLSLPYSFEIRIDGQPIINKNGSHTFNNLWAIEYLIFVLDNYRGEDDRNAWDIDYDQIWIDLDRIGLFISFDSKFFSKEDENADKYFVRFHFRRCEKEMRQFVHDLKREFSLVKLFVLEDYQSN